MIIALTTVSTKRDAKIIAKIAVKDKLAACVQITEINSVYNWKNELRDETEYRLTFKTTKDKLGLLEERVKELHKYSLPQWVWFEANASKEYRDWLEF